MKTSAAMLLLAGISEFDQPVAHHLPCTLWKNTNCAGRWYELTDPERCPYLSPPLYFPLLSSPIAGHLHFLDLKDEPCDNPLSKRWTHIVEAPEALKNTSLSQTSFAYSGAGQGRHSVSI